MVVSGGSWWWSSIHFLFYRKIVCENVEKDTFVVFLILLLVVVRWWRFGGAGGTSGGVFSRWQWSVDGRCWLRTFCMRRHLNCEHIIYLVTDLRKRRRTSLSEKNGEKWTSLQKKMTLSEMFEYLRRARASNVAASTTTSTTA